MNTTEVAHPKFVPVMTTLDPTAPVLGANDVIVGTPAAATMKFVVLTVLPDGASTAIVPLVAPAGTVVVMDVLVATVNVGWFVPLNLTAVALPLLLNPMPVMVTGVVETPHVGLNDVIVAAEAGGATTSAAITPSPSANAATRAEAFFFGNLTAGSSLLSIGSVREPHPDPLDPINLSAACVAF